MAKVFDTYDDEGLDFDRFVKQPLLDGLIVIAACKDDCTSNLSDNAKQWFADMGSQ